MVSRWLQATQSGGCGFWNGLGTTLRAGIWRNSPSQPAKGSSTIILVAASMWSSHCARLVSRPTPKPSSSALDDDSPVPKSTRPSEIRSRVLMRSTTRAVWL